MTPSLNEIFQKYSLSIKRREKNVYSFLERHYKSYIADLNNYFGKKDSAEIKKAKKLVASFSQDILAAIDLYFQGYSAEAYFTFAKRMDEIQDFLIYKETAKNSEYRFCRIRVDEGKTWKDLFHIPFDKRELVKGYRYSIAGFPSLYLAASGTFNSYVRPLDYGTALSLAWFETGMPDKFYWSKFKLKSVEPLKILDLTVSPFSSVSIRKSIETSILNRQPIEDFIIRALITYPLTASCSLIAENKNNSFVPEYVIPQMLLSWVRKNSNCRGIAYLSSSHIEYARRYNAFNVVLPPVSIASKGHCIKLRSEFSISTPKAVEISNVFEERLSTQYNIIRQFRNWLDEIYRNNLGIEGFREILSICNSFIGIYEQIHEKRTKDIQWVYQQIETLNLCAYRMATEKHSEVLGNEVKQFRPGDSKVLKTKEKIWKRWKTVQESFRDFWTFDIKHFQ